jgi:hypothetical protein
VNDAVEPLVAAPYSLVIIRSSLSFASVPETLSYVAPSARAVAIKLSMA